MLSRSREMPSRFGDRTTPSYGVFGRQGAPSQPHVADLGDARAVRRRWELLRVVSVVGLASLLGVGYALAERELARAGGLGTVSPMLAAVYGQVVAAVSPSCNIKGNVSYNTGERIYHVPGQEYYSETVVSSSRGERWFCSEEEARKAGWRRSGI